MRRTHFGSIFIVITLIAAVIGGAAPADARSRAPRPVLFVHGFVGSGGQFETQGQRFTSNGYPASRVAVEEYDSTFATITQAQVLAEIDGRIAQLLSDSGADKVDLVGHSLGTAISQSFLSTPARAAKIAHYVNLDGAPAASPPGSVPTLAVWGEGNTGRQIVGAKNVYQRDHSHVQVATSAETFGAMYRFFNGHRAKTTDIVPQHHVVLSGRVTQFPSNAGAAGTTLQIWRVKPKTGFREGKRPKATFTIGADGSWGPFRGSNHATYEMAVLWPGSTHHFYFEPFLRSDHLIRLVTQAPGTGLDALREKSATTSSVIFVRYKELWGDQGPENDGLSVNGLNILTPSIAPRAKRLNALFAFDHSLDGVTNLSGPIPALAGLPFISGADVYLPASTPPNHTLRIRTIQRGGHGEVERINIPNWPSASNFSSVQLRDFVQSHHHHHH